MEKYKTALEKGDINVLILS